jgi:hypothetical protein
MKTVVFVVDDKHPNGGQVTPCGDTKIWYVRNLPEGDKYHESLGLCGLEISELHTDEKLTAEQIDYLVKRMRGEPSYPTGHDISIWIEEDSVKIGILHHYFRLTQDYDHNEWVKWLDNALEDLNNEG